MHKTLSYLVLILVVVAGSLSSCRKNVMPAGPDPTPAPPPPVVEPPFVETEPAVLTPVTVDIAYNIKGYYQALPVHYEERDDKYPVTIFGHGGGQFGDGTAAELDTVLADGLPKLLKNKVFPPSFKVNDTNYSFVVVIPQFTRRAGPLDIDELVKYVKGNFKIDTSRIYLVGFSLGGRYLLDYAAYKPNEIAAAVAFGGPPAIDEQLTEKCKAMTDAQLPIWQFHNRNDSAWMYTEAEAFINELNSFVPYIAPRFTTFEKGEARKNHDCWTRGSNPEYREEGKNIYEWMLGYRR